MFDIDTGTNKIPSHQFYTGILPSSTPYSLCVDNSTVLLQATLNFIFMNSHYQRLV